MRSDALGEAVAVPCGLLSPQRAAPALQGPPGQLSVSTAVRNPPNCFSHTWEAVVLTRSFPPPPALLPALEAREGVECGQQEHGALPRPAPWGHRSALQGPPAGPTAATAAPGILGAPRALSPAFCLRAPTGVDAWGAGCTVTSAGGAGLGLEPQRPGPCAAPETQSSHRVRAVTTDPGGTAGGGEETSPACRLPCHPSHPLCRTSWGGRGPHCPPAPSLGAGMAVCDHSGHRL